MQSDTPSDDAADPSRWSGGTTRRRLLRTSVNLGLGASLVWGAGYTGPEETVSVVYAHARPSPESESLEARRKQVPAEWYDSLRTALSVQRRLADTQVSSLVGSFVVPGSYDDPTASLSVDATSDRVQDEIAEMAEVVPIDIDVIDDLEPPTDESTAPGAPFEVSDLDDPRVPGGVVCESRHSSGTLAPAMYGAREGDRYFATSNHVYGSEGTLEREHRDESLSVTRDEQAQRIGLVERGFPIADVVKVRPVDGYEPMSEIARADPSIVIGQYTRTGLADLMARGERLEKVGARSGHTTGSILGVDGVTCYTADFCRSGQLKWGGSETMTSGDSGSVSFHTDPENPDDYVLVGGINNARSWWPGADFTWGTAAYDLFARYGLHF